MSKLLEKLQSAQKNGTVITPESSDNDNSPAISPSSMERNVVLNIKDKEEEVENEENGDGDDENDDDTK